jgi:hypothetical protein
MFPADPSKVAVLFGVHAASVDPLTHQLAVVLFQRPEPPLPGLA